MTPERTDPADEELVRRSAARDRAAFDALVRVEEHLRGCDACARFGGEFGATVRALREHLARPAEVPREVAERLRKALDGERS
jgi:anti-sigma factor RsiW